VADKREFAVGDVLTVLVDDYTISTAVKDDLASDRRRSNRDFDLTRPGTSTGVGIDSRNDTDSQRRGEARRENRFQSEMSVRVVAAGPNGTFQIKGSRLIEVDKGRQQVELAGWVRAQDVAPSNVVESSRIADATITYLSPGPVGKPKQGMISRVIGIVWP
jgi:flagellar L-ring protein precursor FlgH